MSTIKINELATSAISLTDLFAKADSNGLMTKNTIQEFSNFLGTVGTLGFKGVLLSTDATVTEDGIYIAGDAGTYTNNGGLVITVNDKIVLISVTGTQTVFEKAEFPITLTTDSAPTNGSTNVAESGGTYDFGVQIAENQNILPNADFRGITETVSDSILSRFSYTVTASKDKDGVSIVQDAGVPFGSFYRSLKVVALTGQLIDVYTGKTDTDIILADTDKYSVGAWIYNDDWDSWDGDLYCIDVHTGVYFESNYIDFNDLRFYYLNNQSFTSASGGVQIRFNIDAQSATSDSNFYISTPAIIKSEFIFPHIYNNFLKTVDLPTDYLLTTDFTNDVFFRDKNYLVDKTLDYSADELTIIDAIIDIIPLKIPSGELSDEFIVVSFYGKDLNNRIQLRNKTTGVNCFDTYVSLGTRKYGGGISLVRTPSAGLGTHEFLIYIDWSKVPDAFGYASSNSKIFFNADADSIGKYNNSVSKSLNFLPVYNDFENKNWDLGGDSISNVAGYWREPANQYLKMTMFNRASSGARVYEQTDDLDTLLAGDATYFDDKQLATFLCIYNTWNTNYALGTSSDSTATASYCGKLKYYIEAILTANNLINVVLMTQYITSLSTNTNGDTLLDFNEKTREIAKLYGCPVIDWGAESGCNEINVGAVSSSQYDRQTFTQDGVHSGRWGAERLAKLFVKGLSEKVGMFF